MALALGPLLVVEGLERRVVLAGAVRRQPHRPPEVRVSLLGYGAAPESNCPDWLTDEFRPA